MPMSLKIMTLLAAELIVTVPSTIKSTTTLRSVSPLSYVLKTRVVVNFGLCPSRSLNMLVPGVFTPANSVPLK
ncbi:hypothetical protein D1872_326100 [compost metagenome]